MADIYVDNQTPGSNTSPYDTWAKAATTLTAALAVATGSDTVWIKNTHSEVTAGAVQLTCPTSPGLKILATSDTSQPPTSITTGAKVRTSGTNSLALDGFAYIYGVEFVAGESSSGNPSVNIASNGASLSHGVTLDNCKLTLAATGAAGNIAIGHSPNTNNKDGYVEVLTTAFKFGASGQGINMREGRLRFLNVSLDAAGSTPTSLFKFVAATKTNCLVESSDLSGRAFTNLANVGTTCNGALTVRNCKLPASISVTTGSFGGRGGAQVCMHNCDSGNTNYRFAEWFYEGSTIDEHTLVRNGGATDGVTANAFKMASSASTLFWDPLKSPEFVQKINSTGSALTCTVDILHDNATGLKDNEVWLELQYLKDSGDPLGEILNDRAANLLSSGATQPSSSATWTSTGMANPNKQKLEVTFTPQQKGYVICRVALAKASYIIYVDNAPSIA